MTKDIRLLLEKEGNCCQQESSFDGDTKGIPESRKKKTFQKE